MDWNSSINTTCAVVLATFASWTLMTSQGLAEHIFQLSQDSGDKSMSITLEHGLLTETWERTSGDECLADGMSEGNLSTNGPDGLTLKTAGAGAGTVIVLIGASLDGSVGKSGAADVKDPTCGSVPWTWVLESD